MQEARTVLGRGDKSLLCDPGSELRLGEKKKGEESKRDGKKINKFISSIPAAVEKLSN